MIGLIGVIIGDVLLTLYQSLGFSLLLSVFVLFFCLYVKELGGGLCGFKLAWKNWKRAFLHEAFFRRLFLLVLYTSMILFRTLLNRSLWLNPLSGVMGGWSILEQDGTLTMEPVENFMLFIPFVLLLLWTAGDKILQGQKGIRLILRKSAKIVFMISLAIELLQLFFRLGTFQLSDLFYNTLGGAVGGMLYWLWEKLRSKRHIKQNAA